MNLKKDVHIGQEIEHILHDSAMGDKRYCAMTANEDTERAIQGLKAKLREKKNS